MFGIRPERVCRLFGACLEFVGDCLELACGPVSSLLGACLERAWSLLEIVSGVFGVFFERLFRVSFERLWSFLELDLEFD